MNTTTVKTAADAVESARNAYLGATALLARIKDVIGGNEPITLAVCGARFDLTYYDHSYYHQRVRKGCETILSELVALQTCEVERRAAAVEGAEFKLREAVKEMLRS